MGKLLQAIRHDLAYAGFEGGGYISLRAKLRIIRYNLQDYWAYHLICKLRGHNYVPDGRDYVESGGEGFSCTRCGAGFMAWH